MTEMEVKQCLSVFLLLIQVSLAVWQHVTVMKGHTVFLTCPITNPHETNVEWKNPEGYIMFFNSNKALEDKRYSITKLSQTEFSISISDVNFKDGGNYTCSHYDHHTTEKKVKVTVLGYPTMSVMRHDGKFVIKCTAEGNDYPPEISWRFNNQPEFLAQTHVYHEDKKYVSMGILNVFPVKKRITVKCLVRHPVLHLINFVKIGQDRTQGNSSLLVLLVTCLVVCLLVVVMFFAIKLRRAHIAWKKENEESAPSEESNKSKSTQDEKNPQGQNQKDKT
ncbi:cytotoxic and regulatory T-cell molecule [Xenentodon cancila]